ncbi:MAG: glycosyltransferase family 4 protein [Actinomycetes bacterium]|jgi:glycosyltransferase involved in cell wall biosynthesis|nr:MAG: glycosyl transferase family 1 [Actinomycetota bacterium]
MRIVHVSDCYAPRTGGIETHLGELTRMQAAQGHEVHVFTSERGPNDERHGSTEMHGAVTVHRLGTLMPMRAPWNPAAGFMAARLLDELLPDVVHAHAGILCPLALGVAKTAMSRGIPVAITWHSMLDRSRLVLAPWARLTGWGDVPAALSAVSRVAAEEVEQVYGGEVRILHDAIDQARWSPAPEAPDEPPPLRLVAAARLVPKKGLGALITAVAEAADDLPRGSLTLDIFGVGPDRKRLETLIRQRGVEGFVRVRGRKPAAKLLAEYHGAHVFCSPAPREAFGIAALEARSAGLIVLGRRGNGHEEFLQSGVDSILVDDMRDMRRAIIRLATDRARFRELRDRARSVTPDFTYERVCEDTYAEYERAIDLARSGIRLP